MTMYLVYQPFIEQLDQNHTRNRSEILDKCFRKWILNPRPARFFYAARCNIFKLCIYEYYKNHTIIHEGGLG